MSEQKKFKIGELEKHSGLLRILLILINNGEINFQQFIDTFGMFPNSLYPSIDKAEELGLIAIRLDKVSRVRKKMISLTKKGRQVAELLLQIEDLL